MTNEKKLEALKTLNEGATKYELRKALMALFSLTDTILGQMLSRTRVNMNMVIRGKNKSRVMQDEVAEILGVPRKEIFD